MHDKSTRTVLKAIAIMFCIFVFIYAIVCAWFLLPGFEPLMNTYAIGSIIILAFICFAMPSFIDLVLTGRFMQFRNSVVYELSKLGVSKELSTYMKTAYESTMRQMYVSKISARDVADNLCDIYETCYSQKAYEDRKDNL